MTAHTPGPWHRNIPPATKYVTVWSGRSKHVAQVVCRGLSDAEVEANIDLIAAAPELLQSLTEAVEFAEQDGMALTPLGEAMIDRWRASVAKARGEAAFPRSHARIRAAVAEAEAEL